MPDDKQLDPRIMELAKEISIVLKNRLPEGAGFALMLFDFRDDGFYWVSNGNRQDILNALRVVIRENDVH